MSKMRRLGFIGLGALGRRIVQWLLWKGYTITIYDLRKEVVEEFVRRGAKPAKSSREVGEASDIVFICVPGPADVEEAVLGDGGALEGMRPGSILIDVSTVDPGTNIKIGCEAEKKGVHVLDAPLSIFAPPEEYRLEHGAAIFVGGDKSVFDSCLDIFQDLSANFFYIGELGKGNVIKLINQMLGHVANVTTCEAVIMCLKAGIDPLLMKRAISKGGGGRVLGDVESLIRGQFDVWESEDRRIGYRGARMGIHEKDMRLAVELAHKLHAPVPVSSAAYQLYSSALSLGLLSKDEGAIIEVFKRMTATEFPKPS